MPDSLRLPGSPSRLASCLLALHLWVSLAPLQAQPAAMLTAPGSLLSGGRTSVVLTLIDEKTHQPLQTSLRLELNSAAAESHLLFSGSTDASGHSRIAFDVPALPAGSYTLRARLGTGSVLELATTVSSAPALLIETDKPLYQPGQTLHGRVLLLKSDLSPAAGPVEIVIHDGKGIRVARRLERADEYGAVAFSLDLATELNQGQWQIRARSGGVESVRDVRVEPYVLPRFDLGLTLPRDWALASDTVAGTVQADYFFGKPVEGTVEVSAARWVGTWEEYATAEGALQGGRWTFQLPPVRFVAGTPQFGGEGAVRLEVAVTDSTGHRQTLAESLRISPSAVVAGLVAAAPTLKPQIPVGVSVTTRSPGGTAVDTGVRLTAVFSDARGSRISAIEDGVTTRAGFYLWTLTPPAGTVHADLTAIPEAPDAATTAIRLNASYSPSDNFLSLVRTDGDDPAAVGRLVRFTAASTTPGTLYYEVFGAGRTVFSDFVEGDSFAFPVTFEMVPKCRVVAYKIGADNEVVADSWTLQTALPPSPQLATSFAASPVRPGQPVQVTIDTGLGRRALLGISLVDESVLALGRSRLHLEQVFAELEKRFLEPVAQVIVEDPLPIGLGVRFFAPIPTPGASDVFHGAGLKFVSTANLLIPDGRRFDDREAPIRLSPPAAGGGQAAQPPETPRLRQFFPETWVWEPLLLTDDQGRATLTLEAPDSITSWRLSVVSTLPQSGSQAGTLQFGENHLTVFQDFFVEPALPHSVVRGETVPLKVDLFNYLDQPQSIELSLQESPGFKLAGNAARSVEVPAQSAISVTFPLRALQAGSFPVRLTALGSSAADAVLRELKIVPEGFPVERVENGILEPGRGVSLTAAAPPEAVSDSGRAILSLAPSPVAQSLEGLADLLQLPYGCGEQNMIFLAPDIEALKYMRKTGDFNPAVRAQAEYFINVGYQRQLTFQTDDGGFAAFGGPTGSLWLTAFVLSTFAGAREVRDIDGTVLAESAAMLVARQREDGSFETDRFLIHTEMAGSETNDYAMAAYVANALLEYGGAETAAALDKAATYLSAHRTNPDVQANPYPLAIAALALTRITGYEAVASDILDGLLALARSKGPLLYWETYAVETTAYAILALLSAGGAERPQAQQALNWLLTQRTGGGGFGSSTQDTVVALRALFTAARNVTRQLDLRVLVQAGETLLDVAIDRSNFDLLHQVEIPLGRPVEIVSEGRGTIAYQLFTRYNLPGERLPSSKDLLFEVHYATDHVEVDEIVDVSVRLLYAGLKGRTGMVIADVGVPSGFEPVRASLDALVEKNAVERVEVAGRKIIFYIEELHPGRDLRFAFQVRAVYPVRAAATVSQAYEYYDSSLQSFDVSEAAAVVDPKAAPRIEDISRRSGPGGTRLEITGSGFLGGVADVLFNGISGRDIEIVDDYRLLVTVPNLLPGDVSVTLLNASGSSIALPGRFEIRPSQIFYPLYAGQSFTAYALSNASSRSAEVDVTAFQADGSRAELGRNPVKLALGAGKQRAWFASELFQSPPQALSRVHWVELVSNNSAVGSLLQFGDGRGLDGLGPFLVPATRLWFTRIYEGPNAYRGYPVSTRLTLANPASDPARVKLTLISPDQEEVEIERVLPPRGVIDSTAAELFARQQISAPAYVAVEVLEGGGVAGFERIEIDAGRTVVGLSAALSHDRRQAWSTHFAHTGEIFSELKLINTGAEARRLQLTLVLEDGREHPLGAAITLQPGQALQQESAGLFSLSQESSEQLLVGSLRLLADGPGVLGDVLFGRREQVEYAAALPLQTQPLRRALFSHVGEGGGFYTGLALHNPGQKSIEVTLQVFASDGELRGKAALELAPGARLSRRLGELVAEADGLLGGYLILESSGPLLAVEAFGDLQGTSLSAVLPAP